MAIFIVLNAAAPLVYFDAQQKSILARPHIGKRGIDIFSPVFNTERPDSSIFAPIKPSTPFTPSNPFTFPWSKPSTPAPQPPPKLVILEPECTYNTPYCPARPVSPIVESIRESISGLGVPTPKKPAPEMPVLTVPQPRVVVVSGNSMTASALGRNIVAQIPVDCPHCGLGGGPKASKWAMFVEWLKGAWERFKGNFKLPPMPMRPEEYPDYAAAFAVYDASK